MARVLILKHALLSPIQLKDTEGYEIESVLAGTDGWNPIANGNALVNIKR